MYAAFDVQYKDNKTANAAAVLFHDYEDSIPVFRGQSRRPLYITAAGMTIVDAALKIARMHGNHRIPTLLKQVDLVAREKIAHHAR